MSGAMRTTITETVGPFEVTVSVAHENHRQAKREARRILSRYRSWYQKQEHKPRQRPARTTTRPTVAELDALWRDLIKQRDGHRCQRCGSTTGQLQAAHIFTRSRRRTRWDPDNGVCLCAGCHMATHRRPEEFMTWARRWLGEGRYRQLRMRFLAPGKVDLGLVKLMLQDELRKAG